MSDQPKEHPILFSGPMVRAVLDGRKTQTRRLSKRWLKVKKGEGLWVRETWRPEYETDTGATGVRYREDAHYEYDPQANPYLDGTDRWRPSIHMPRWASRIKLKATEDARLERLQDISEADCYAEGVQLEQVYATSRPVFRSLWDSINTKTGERWEDNPEVVVLAFRQVEHPRTKA